MATRLTQAIPLPRSAWSVAKYVGIGYTFYSLVGQFIQVTTAPDSAAL